jgi:S1-C subfamily serine protease
MSLNAFHRPLSVLGACFWLALSAAAIGADVPDPVLQAEQQRIEAIAKATKPAVAVFSTGGQGGGSGVVITPDGYALTNYHVVKPAGDYMQCSMADGKLYDAVIVGIDPTGDVALIKLLGRDDFPTAELADSDLVRAGDWCFAIGNPFLLATDFQPTISYGIVSGNHRYQPPAGTLLEYADCIQTDAAINPGNSGGPLFNAQGQLIGINGRCSFEKRGRVNVGVGYAISINQIKKFLGYLHSGRIVDHATLGATVASTDDGTVVVSNILDSSDAYRRGMRYGDEMLSFGNRTISSVNGFKNMLGTYPKGWRVPLSYRHKGERRDVYVRLAGVHARDELLKKMQQAPTRPQPKPRGDGEPKPDQPGDPQDKPRVPRPRIPTPHRPPNSVKQAPPEHVAKLIKKRMGYANYYFNELNRDRVWSAFTNHGNPATVAGQWKLSGQVAGGGPFEISLGADTADLFLPGQRARINVSEDLDAQLLPAGSGGMLPALHVWQHMLSVGPQQFGDVYYLGTCPVIDHPELCDVLVGTYNVVEARFFFDPTTGHLVRVEMYPDMSSDPCEIHFDEYRDQQGVKMPHRIRVRYGSSQFVELAVDKYEFSGQEDAN